jgi:large subunit ribosomal protein L32
MAVPKKRTSKMKKRQRRSHHHLTPVQLLRCSNCGHAVRAHRVCGNCGYYGEKAVIVHEDF